MNKWLAFTCFFLGGLGALLGVVFILMYAWGAIISRMGEPDQSLLFWYLPILFLGIAVGGGGVSLLVFGLRAMRTTKGVRT